MNMLPWIHALFFESVDLTAPGKPIKISVGLLSPREYRESLGITA